MTSPATSPATAGAIATPTARRAPPTLRRRLPMLVMGVLSLLAGLWGGLLLLGLHLPTLRTATATEHGPLMALGFLGTVISLERAVALRRAWGFAAPVAAGLAGLALLVGLPAVVGWSLLCLASVVLCVVYAVVYRIQPALHLKVMAAGGVCWYITTVLWLGGWSVPQLAPWLTGWLVLTILGERLELARVGLLTPRSIRSFTVAANIFAAGLALTVATSTAQIGVRLAGVGLITLAVWGASYDVARRTVKIAGVTRFMAVCLLSGYVWLVAAGVTWLVAGDLGGSVATYDLALHAVFLGFVMSMVFGHAPVIVPAVLSTPLPFTPWFYAHVALLHAALFLRLVVGDGLGSTLAWQIGGVGTELAILLFIGASATAAVRARSKRKRRA
ncbi:MAG: hypothetical protein ACXVXP_07230 [Mycobacteriaceae bacterium]